MPTSTTTLSSHTAPNLAARFRRDTFVIRSDTPLVEDQMRRAAPSIFATGKHGSRYRPVYLHPHQRSPARLAARRLRALHGGAEQEPD